MDDFGTDGPVSPLRQRMMRSVRRANTRPEVTVRKSLFERGYRYRLHVKGLPGTPDIVFPGRDIALFVHGCFWHRHAGCRYATTPKTRVDFWNNKFLANQRRDAESRAKLEEMGWHVIEIWECDVKSGAYLASLLDELGPPRMSVS
jgi:DNA mismatch endonuclease (patch repair protein)